VVTLQLDFAMYVHEWGPPYTRTCNLRMIKMAILRKENDRFHSISSIWHPPLFSPVQSMLMTNSLTIANYMLSSKCDTDYVSVQTVR
jgi:hypothetical protein